MKQEIKSLEIELAQFRENIERSREEVKRLTTDSLYLEKIAREKYLMKRENEDIFIFNETVE
jgi:cell division protein FtsB